MSFRRALKEENNQFILILKYLLEGIFLLKVQTILKLFVHTNNVLIGAIGVDGICLESKKTFEVILFFKLQPAALNE